MNMTRNILRVAAISLFALTIPMATRLLAQDKPATAPTALVQSPLAKSDMERELQQRSADRTRAIAAATDSINAKHLASLHALLRRATRTKDSKSAAQITEAIGTITVIGTWSVVVDNGYRTNLTIRPDGSFFGTNGDATGRWDIRGGKLIITNPTNQDIYDLPENDTMNGVNTKGPKMTASRISK